MRCLNLRLLFLRIGACCIAALAMGCSSLQIDVDVYKGPLTHERYIQVRQYASMAAAAKPLIADMHRKMKLYDDAQVHAKGTTASAGKMHVRMKIRPRRVQFLCEILELYRTVKIDDGACDSVPPSTAPTHDVANGKMPVDSTKIQPRVAPYPREGLDYLTFQVAQEMDKQPSPDRQFELNAAVDRLSEALILFAQKLVYITNTELLFSGETPTLWEDVSYALASSDSNIKAAENFGSHIREDKQWEKSISVLQALGNTILVHANDLRRQTERDRLHIDRSASLSGAVQHAFQPEPSATVDGILQRLQHFSLTPVPEAKDVEAIDTATPQQRKAVEDSEKALQEFNVSIASLMDAYCTLVIDIPPKLVAEAQCDTNQEAVASDRRAIQGLYAGEHATKEDGLQPLSNWLTIQTAKEVAPTTIRLARLAAFKDYLSKEQGRLRAAGVTEKTTRANAMTILKEHLAMNVGDARSTAARHARSVASALEPISKQNQREAAQLAVLARQAKAASDEAMREKMTRVVRTYRSALIVEAETLGTRDPELITAMLLRRMKKEKDSNAAAKAGEPTPEELGLTIEVVKRFPILKAPCHVSEHSARCKGETSIEVLDNLIAALRAQHVQAVAVGNDVAATNLLKAVNAAYDQRTAMIYLRPASDYLRSVYASTSLQDGTKDEHRNMLVGWFKNLRGNFMRDDDAREKIEAKRELDKINWQNVNKVTLSGGGSTNYVIAKDDVGNWYVKAYGADPEAIVKSATSLALFNAGKGVNVNLLRRVDAQRRLDEDRSLSDSERTALQKDVIAVNPADAQALLKVRDRYAARYVQDTLMQAATLLATMKEMPTKASARLAEVASWPGGACTKATAGDLLKPLEGTHLAAPRDRIAATLAETTTPAKVNAAMLAQVEQNIQAGLTAMHLYGSAVQPALKHGKGEGCDIAEQAAAKRVRDDVRAQIVAAATTRLSSIERYEDALTGVLDIASEK